MSIRPASGKESLERLTLAAPELHVGDRGGPEGSSGNPFDRERGGPSLRAETGAALERQLLLVQGPGEELLPALSRSRWPRAVGAIAILIAIAATGLFSFLQARGHWEAKVATLEAKIAEERQEIVRREEALRRESAEKDRAVAERKAESQSLAALASKTLEELRAALEETRKARAENGRLESELRETLKERASPFAEMLKRWLAAPRPAAGGAPVPAAGPEPDSTP